MSYKQLEIRWVDLEPTKGAETRKKRPCPKGYCSAYVIIQSDIVNRGSKTVIVAPILPGHKDWLFAVNIIPTKDNGLDKERHVNLKQLRAVDISRVQNLQGNLETEYLQPIQDTLKIVFGF